MSRVSYKNDLDGYNNLDYWTGKTEKSARREVFYYDETDLIAFASTPGKSTSASNTTATGSTKRPAQASPTIVNLLMDPLEKVTPDARGYEYAGRKFVGEKLSKMVHSSLSTSRAWSTSHRARARTR